MDIARISELGLGLEHRHSDGAWSPLEQRSHHDPADADPERGWANTTIYVCRACDEQVRVVDPVKDPGNPRA